MAYRAEIEVAVKGAAQLQKFQGRLEASALAVDNLNKFLTSFAKEAGGVSRSVKNLSAQLSLSARNFNEVALGTDEAKTAAIEYAQATKNLNQGLAERAALLKQVVESERKAGLATKGIRETTQFAGPIGPGAASSVLGGQSMPIEGRTARILQARREENELQQALLRLEQKSVREQNDKVEALGRGKQEVLDVIKAAKTGPKLPPGFDFKKGELQTKTRLAEDASIKQINQRRQQEREILSDQISNDLKAAKQRLDSNTKVFDDFMAKNKIAIDDFDKRLDAADKKQQARQAKRAQRIKGALGSGLIGGGFPLLFGQGGASAVGGALGGVVGGAIGDQFGFALSVIGTALGQAIEKSKQFKDALERINNTLGDSSGGAQLLRQDIDDLANSLEITKDEALQVAEAFAFLSDPALTKQAGKVFGEDTGLFQAVAGIKDQQTFARALEQSLGTLNDKEVERLLTELATADAIEQQIGLVDALNRKRGKEVVTSEFQRRRQARTGFKAETTLVPAAPELVGQEATLFERISPLLRRLEEFRSRPRSLSVAETGDSLAQSLKRQLARYEEIEPLARARAVIEADHQVTLERISKVKDDIKRKDLETLAGKVKQARLDDLAAKDAKKKADKEDRRIKTFRQRLTAAESEGRILQASLSGKEREQRLIEDIAQKTKGLSVTEAKLVEDRLRSNDVLRRQKEVMDELKAKVDEIGATFKNAFVDGIQSAIDGSKTLGQVLSNMLNQLSRQLLEISANQLFGSAKSGTGLLGSIAGLFSFGGGGGGGNGLNLDLVDAYMANGGSAKAGGSYIVGERGPELFVPRTSGTVVPNHAMGGASVTVNVDASGSSVDGNGNEAAQLGKAIGVAVQQELIKQKRPGGLLAS